MRKPRSLHPGGTLGIVSPASTPNPKLVAAGTAQLEQLGYRTRLFPHALDAGPLYFAGTVADRVADLHAAFSDPQVDAVLCTRGGCGSAELLPHLDAALVARAAKPFLGYSDQTALHLWMARACDLISFQAPMVAADFSRPDGFDLASWQAALGAAPAWTVGPAHGLRVLRPGVAEGPLDGGCISIYTESLGTPFAPVAQSRVLFLEDIGTKPYQWGRMLVHLRQAGMLADVRGIVFGDMQQCCAADEMSLLEAALLHALSDFNGPIAIGLRSGHVAAGNITLPFGVRVQLDCSAPGNPRIHFLEPATEG